MFPRILHQHTTTTNHHHHHDQVHVCDHQSGAFGISEHVFGNHHETKRNLSAYRGGTRHVQHHEVSLYRDGSLSKHIAIPRFRCKFHDVRRHHRTHRLRDGLQGTFGMSRPRRRCHLSSYQSMGRIEDSLHRGGVSPQKILTTTTTPITCTLRKG